MSSWVACTITKLTSASRAVYDGVMQRGWFWYVKATVYYGGMILLGLVVLLTLGQVNPW